MSTPSYSSSSFSSSVKGKDPEDTTTKDEKQTSTSSSDKRMTVRVASQNGSTLDFTMKPTTTFDRMMNAYCKTQGVTPTSVRFLFDGQRITEKQTPQELGVDDGDVIDVVLQQTGGSASVY